jgi:LysM repeat protein
MMQFIETQQKPAKIHEEQKRISSARYWTLLIPILFILWLFLWPVMSQAQADPTSTPDPEGNIYYMVQPNDSLWSIAARSGISLQELLDLNEIEEDSVVNPGDQILIGHVTPAPTPTSDFPTPTLPPPLPTETPILLRTAICMTAFDDINRDGIQDAGELLLAGVAFTVFNDQIVVANYITDGVAEPYCLEGLDAGTYHVTRSVAPNEVLTTQGDWAMTLTEGNELNLAFGSYQEEDSIGEDAVDADAQFETRVAGTPATTPTADVQSNDRAIAGVPLMMILLGIGIIALLLAVAVLLFWFVYSRNKET